MQKIYDRIRATGIIPVVVMDDADKAEALAGALCEGGLPCAEVTFRTAAAEETIRRMKKSNPDMLVGAGTVLTKEQADRAIGAGAGFLVSPGFNPEVCMYAMKKGVPFIPGVMTPTEIEQAMAHGITMLKFFPATAAGGVKMLSALASPYQAVSFMPTGGISADNAAEFLALKNVYACGGSWMVKKDLIASGAFDRIREMCREAADIVARVRMK